eukprot:CAMPEP_0185698568 /NCGR_PEP_ID=MMETSP1164-20130828/6405_1 /TAXON_ID=1104430 /ORGANISM="Chrysoreinhardia sp, Strain CCMP2950" /LENGTH=135 /DNA_ID=CAMNT_0028365483 /DNA_START=77 /DNA_END=481 /DNA_ORIENTATION=+
MTQTRLKLQFAPRCPQRGGGLPICQGLQQLVFRHRRRRDVVLLGQVLAVEPRRRDEVLVHLSEVVGGDVEVRGREASVEAGAAVDAARHRSEPLDDCSGRGGEEGRAAERLGRRAGAALDDDAVARPARRDDCDA